MSDSGSNTPRPATTRDLDRLRAERPEWHIRHASDDHPGELGYIASRGGVLLTAENLTRLGDRIAEADRSWPAPPPPAILITGPPGWNSGPCLDPGGPLGKYMGRWAIDVQPAQVPVWSALRQRGTERRVLVAFTPADLAGQARWGRGRGTAASPGWQPGRCLMAGGEPGWPSHR